MQIFGEHQHQCIRLAYNGSNHFDVILFEPADDLPSPLIQIDTPLPKHTSPKVGVPYRVISSNITSLRKNWPLLSTLNADLFLCQEITLNANGQNSMKRVLVNNGCRVSFGPATKPKLSGSPKKFSLWNACSGGLLPLSLKRPIALQTYRAMVMLSPVVSAQCRGVYIFNVYGYVGAGPKNAEAYRNNENLLEEIFARAATLGDVPILVIGDFQTDPQHSKTLGTLILSGCCHDLGNLYTNNDWTFQKGSDTSIRTLIDLAICNSVLLPFISSCSVIVDSGLPSHRPILIEFTFSPALDSKFVYRKPKRPSLEKCAKKLLESQEELSQEELNWEKHSQAFDDLCNQCVPGCDAQTNIDKLFNMWSTASENSLLAVSNNLGKKIRGRGSTPRIVKTCIEAPAHNRFVGAATIRLLSLRKLLRRFKQLLAKLNHVCPSPHFSEQITKLQQNIDQSWGRLCPNSACPSLDDICQVQSAVTLLESQISTEEQSISTKRLQTFKEFLVADWQGQKKATYKWMRNAEPFVVPVFQTSAQEFAVKHYDLHQPMVSAWSPIFNRYQDDIEPNFDEFLSAFPSSVPAQPMYSETNPFTVSDILADEVAQTISELKVSSAGVDAWQVCELQLLGQHSISRLTTLLNQIELTGVWPTQLAEIPVAALKKPSGSTPMDVRPISLASLIYRIWARVRWKHFSEWYQSWLPEQLKGGVARREATDASFELMMEVERCHHSKLPLFGVLYDYRKCFDMVPWSIESGLLRTLGLPQRILTPMFAFAKGMQRRFKFGNSVGPLVGNTNSIMQGCPLAILRINCIIAAWVRVIANSPDTQLCRTSAYIDDKSMRSHHLNDLQKAIDLTDQFDQAIHAQVNVNKTATFANSASALKSVAKLHIQGQNLQPVNNENFLGGQMSFASKRCLKIANLLARAFLDVSKRVMICPLNADARATLLATIGATKYTFGLELGGCALQLERTLRSSILSCVWSKRPMKCSDIVLSLCFKGHLFDPIQLRCIWSFKIARRQLLKSDQLRQMWTFIWIQSSRSRSTQTNKSQKFGPLSVIQSIA